mmetsp:Transcript_13468/g.40094  ORF Transcript_13468/g.40094 Transcript_13468/m.40094 type:complete len:155 (+) Transcript_13468:194-658(+)
MAEPPKKKAKREKVGCGVGVLSVCSGAVLLGRRKGAHGAGSWALPGGWLEVGEEFAECAARELEEETGLSAAGELRTIPFVSNNANMDGVHSVTVFVRADFEGERPSPQNREPDKCHEWRWCPVAGELPTPLFAPLANLVASDYWRDHVVRSDQ